MFWTVSWVKTWQVPKGRNQVKTDISLGQKTLFNQNSKDAYPEGAHIPRKQRKEEPIAESLCGFGCRCDAA